MKNQIVEIQKIAEVEKQISEMLKRISEYVPVKAKAKSGITFFLLGSETAEAARIFSEKDFFIREPLKEIPFVSALEVFETFKIFLLNN